MQEDGLLFMQHFKKTFSGLITKNEHFKQNFNLQCHFSSFFIFKLWQTVGTTHHLQVSSPVSTERSVNAAKYRKRTEHVDGGVRFTLLAAQQLEAHSQARESFHEKCLAALE